MVFTSIRSWISIETYTLMNASNDDQISIILCPSCYLFNNQPNNGSCASMHAFIQMHLHILVIANAIVGKMP